MIAYFEKKLVSMMIVWKRFDQLRFRFKLGSGPGKTFWAVYLNLYCVVISLVINTITIAVSFLTTAVNLNKNENLTKKSFRLTVEVLIFILVIFEQTGSLLSVILLIFY